MRHRARRPLLLRRAVVRLRGASSGRRLAAAASALVVAGAGVGVVIAVNQQGPGPMTSAVPPLNDAGAAASAITDHPSGRISRSGKRKSLSPGTTPAPSPTGTATEELSATGPALSTGSSGPGSPRPSRSGSKTSRPQPSDSTSPSPAGSPDASADPSPDSTPLPSPDLPVDETPPQTTATTTAVGGDSWTVLLGANEPAGFACSLDGGPFAPCAVTATFTGLTRGTHTLAARATDLVGNTDPTPAQLTVKVHGPA